MQFTLLTAGDPAPGFAQRSVQNPRFTFDSAAGRYLVLCFFGSAGDEHAQSAVQTVLQHKDIFNDNFACFFAVSTNPEDEAQGRGVNHLPGYRQFWDFDLKASRLYGAAAQNDAPSFRRQWVIIDPTMRVIEVVGFRPDRSDIAQVIEIMRSLPPPARFAGPELMAPVLFLPRVFEPELCARLIKIYEDDGGRESGFMREVDGKTVGVSDHSFKRRKDCDLNDPELIRVLQNRILRRVVPQINKAYRFNATRMERYIVSCYSAEDGGHFSPQRDNTTKGTAHRRFAVSINLNDDFTGGEVNFPEYGPRSFKAPPGGAVVFSCSLLHHVSKVTAGRRYAFLPFLYDDAAAKIRQENLRFLGGAEGEKQADETKSANQNA